MVLTGLMSTSFTGGVFATAGAGVVPLTFLDQKLPKIVGDKDVAATDDGDVPPKLSSGSFG